MQIKNAIYSKIILLEKWKIMKISQDLIVFDLEATSSQSEEGFQENDNIIQIGAVYLKRIENKRYEITNRFNKIVRPRDEQITPFIEELTGISNEIASKASYFDIVGKEFSDWASANGSIKSTRLCAWGTYFDVPLIRKQYQKEKMLYPFSGTAYDVKTWTALWFMLSGRRTEKMSVGNVAKLMNITHEGALHDASVDAELTAKIAIRVFEDLDHGLFIDDTKDSGKSTHFKLVPKN